jgi:hypothetical protein
MGHLQRAADDFRTLFSTDMPPEVGIKKRNEEKHIRFLALQMELMIPTIEKGRKFALKFYYGKLLNAIRVLRVRERFRIMPNDKRKLNPIFNSLGAITLMLKHFWLLKITRNTLISRRRGLKRCFTRISLPRTVPK